MNTSWMLFKGLDWPSAGVMLVLGSFVDDKLWFWIIKKRKQLYATIGVCTRCAPCGFGANHIFRLRSFLASTLCSRRTSSLQIRNKRTFNPRSCRRGLGITGREGCERRPLTFICTVSSSSSWVGRPAGARQAHTHVHCSLRSRSPQRRWTVAGLCFSGCGGHGAQRSCTECLLQLGCCHRRQIIIGGPRSRKSNVSR